MSVDATIMDVDEPMPEAGPSRTIDIELGAQEVISVDLDNLVEDPGDIIELLAEGSSKVPVWTKIAGEYWKKGALDAAERIARMAVQTYESTGNITPLSPVYLQLACLQIARARDAPKLIIPNPRRDDMTKEQPKDRYYKDAAVLMNKSAKVLADSGSAINDNVPLFLTRGVHQLAMRSLDDALASFDTVLQTKPTNLVALLGKARIFYARRQYPQALKLFQQVLTLSPYSEPDPRIGIGLCLWAMDHKSRAVEAWQRSLEVNPSSWPAHLLLGLESINASKDPTQIAEERTRLYVSGTKHIERAFHATNQRNAAAANALCEFFMRKGDEKRALKLAERTVQFADTLAILADGYIHAGQLAQAEGSKSEAGKNFAQALKYLPKSVIAAIGQAQVQLDNDEIAAAIHTLDTLLLPPNPSTSLEAKAMLASLRAYPRSGVSSSDLQQDRKRARELFDQVMKAIDSLRNGDAPPRKTISLLAEDVDMYTEIARLWQDDSIDRMRKAYQDAVDISAVSGRQDPRLLNNLAALKQLEGDAQQARGMYEQALTQLTSLDPVKSEHLSTTILYNLARVYEDQGDGEIAKEAYDKLLARHPEYVDAKIRQARLLANLNRHNEAHELIKQTLQSANSNLNIRAFYTHFLIESNLVKPAKEFVFATLKEHDKHDVYALCAAGWLHYQQARESRDVSSKGLEDKKRNYRMAAEFYEKALHYDATCAFAAQGLAIVTAEDVMSTLSGVSSDDHLRRLKNSREALDIFGKIRESVNDGSVYLNMGHCYYARDEFDRAIESYETALKRFQNGLNYSVLLCLCRSWYAKAAKEQSFGAMNTALRYAQMGLHIHPNDKAVTYNIAMIEQKACEMMFAVPPAKRSLKELQRAIEQGVHAQKLFASLAADTSPSVPYNKDIADQRRKYGDGLLKKADDNLAAQRKHDEEVETRLHTARQKRQDDKERAEALEREREEQHRKEAEELAEARRKAREEAQAWSLAARGDSDDEQRERRPRKSAAKKAPRPEAGSGDEGAGATGEVKKRRKGKLRREGDAADGGENGLFSEDEGAAGGEDKPTKKRSQKKRTIRDDDDDEETAAVTTNPRKKQYKSKETIDNSDEEME